ncbi:4'-phosphopantetheinyl transferase family protein [Edaphovirga cremea]|uniref:4'-phosphopantetheinyl transferase family protein n=1 Tax=Edaphovirga cremea TaxID=2267246 RepID=UPI000DEF0C68|nr:4'-phosphopantetheinyl transferase superfamily protein [Edaphovirga cremea]
MGTPFIENFEWISIPVAGTKSEIYPGLIARSRFNVKTYHPELFARFDIVLPASLNRAVPKRQAEFLAGRYLAEQVLTELGLEKFELQSGEDRAPQWPERIRGSISHNENTALCAAHSGLSSSSGVGVDIETYLSQERAEALWGMIINEQEKSLLTASSGSFAHQLTVAFSAKESLFKALYPQARRYFDFLDAELVRIDPSAGYFELVLLKDLHVDYLHGRVFQGTYLAGEHDVITFITCE